jgi:hypothetical protein
MGDESDAETCTLQHNTRKRQASMSPAGFEPASERPQTHALDRAATGIRCGEDHTEGNIFVA